MFTISFTRAAIRKKGLFDTNTFSCEDRETFQLTAMYLAGLCHRKEVTLKEQESVVDALIDLAFYYRGYRRKAGLGGDWVGRAKQRFFGCLGTQLLQSTPEDFADWFVAELQKPSPGGCALVAVAR